MHERVNLFPSPILITHQPPTWQHKLCGVAFIANTNLPGKCALVRDAFHSHRCAPKQCVCGPTDRDRSRRVINWLATKERSEATKQQEARENGWQYHPSSCHFVCSQAPRESTDESLTSFPAIQSPNTARGQGFVGCAIGFVHSFTP